MKLIRAKSFTILGCFLFATSITFAQTIASDSRGKEVFNFYKSKSLSIPISVATSSFKLNSTFLLGKGTQYYVGAPKIAYSIAGYSLADQSRFTVAKSTGLNLSFGVGNILSNLSKVSTFHPTYSLGIGIGRNIDVFNNWDNIHSLKSPVLYTWNINTSSSIDNLLIYDTTAKIQQRKKPFTQSVSAEGALFFTKSKRKFLTSISGSIIYDIGNNISTLKGFQKNKPTYSNSDIISLGDVIGKLGDLKDQNTVRGRFSIPLFPNSFFVYKQPMQLCIVPYYSFYGKINTHLSHLVGAYLNLTAGNNLFFNSSTIVPGFGIGIDWAAAKNGLSNASVFVGGSLDLHTVFAHKKPANK